MPIEIEAPDGSVAEFPDGTPDAVITSVMRKTFGGPQIEEKAPPSALQPGFLSDDPRDWEAQRQAAGPAPAPKARGILLPLAEGEGGKIGLGLPGLIHDPVENARKIIRRGPVHPSEVTGEMGVEGLTAASAGMSGTRFPYATRGAIQGAAAAEEAATRALGPRIHPELPVAPRSPVVPTFRDNTGALFVEGDKPVYANASREGLDLLFGPEYAKRFDAFESITATHPDGSPYTVWFKPGERARAQQLAEMARRGPGGDSPAANDLLWGESTARMGQRTQNGRSGLEQWTDADGTLNIRIRPTAKETITREASALPTPVELPRAAVGGTVTQATAGGLSSTPLGTPIIQQSRKAVEQLGENVKGVADDMGSGGVVSAGEGARDSILSWIKKEMPAGNAENYTELDKLINKGVTVPLNRTRITAGELAAKDAESASQAGARVVADVRAAIQRQGMTYEGIKNLRTLIRERLDSGLEPGVSERYMRSIYKALGDDLRFAVERSGVKGKGKQAALDAFEAANTAAAKAFEKREALLKIIGSEGKDAPEAVLERLGAMASAKGGADITRLAQAKSVMGEGAWNEVGSALLNRMGETKDGFSIARWRTAYDKLSENGKSLLFGGEHKATLDRVFRVGASAEQLAKWGNPSGTTRGAMTTAAVLGLFLHPYAVLGAAAADYGMARLLARPATAKNVAGWMERYSQYALGPSKGREQLLQQATRILAEDIAAQSGGDPREIETRLAPRPAGQQGASGGSGGDGSEAQAEAPRVESIEDALKLPKGTRFTDPLGVERVR